MHPRTFIKNTIRYSLPAAISAFVGIAVIPLITRIYPTDEYGVINLFYSTGVLLSSVFTLGLHSACVRFFYEPIEGRDRKEAFNLAAIIGIGTSLVFGILCLTLFKERVSLYLFGEVNAISIVLFISYIISNIIYKLQSNFARLSQNAFAYNLQQILYVFINKVFFVLAVLYSTNYFYSILLIALAMLLETSVLGTRYCKLGVKLPNKSAVRQLFAYALPLLPNDIAVMLNNSAAKLVLSFFGDYHALGIISMGTNLANTFNVFTTAFSVYWSAFFYENYIKEQKMIREIHNVILFLSVILTSAIFIFQDILYMLLGSAYKSSQPYFLLIMLLPIQTLICETTSYGVSISKKTYISLIISIFTCVVNVACCFILYPTLGAMAMAIGIAGSAVLQMILKTAISQRFYCSIQTRYQTIIGFGIISIICVFNIWLYDQIVLRIILGMTACLGAAILFKQESAFAIMTAKKYLKILQRRGSA